ncbi:MAG TPA: zinc-dependent metalloprotease [Dermatophilaceae bacterium]|nr:zinc-dependent metalloprotease [Dermatophilaceae bacterium]
MADLPQPRPDEPGDLPDMAELLRQVQQALGDSDNPEVAEALKAMGIDRLDPASMQLLGAQMQAMLAASADRPFNAALAGDVARQQVATTGDRTVGAAARREVEQAVHVAALWLDAVTDLSVPGSGPTGAAQAWSRAEWVDQTMPVWRALVDPVAAGVSAAVVSALRAQLGRLGESGMELPAIPGLPAGTEPTAMMGQMEPMLTTMSSAMFGVQVGQAVGALAADMVSGTEVGLPLVGEHAVVLLPANIEAFAAGLGVDHAEVVLYLATREVARVRLFAAVPWLGPLLLEAVQAYARDISIDTERIEAAVREVNPSDPAAMQAALSESLFTPEPSAAQAAALQRLETYLALVEGWVDVVAEQATTGHLPQTAALGEAVRRRRATGGPAERMFSQLVGLELRPRRLRDAATLFRALHASSGPAGRDTAWAHPDLAPTAADLDDPLGYVERVRSAPARDELDDALESWLRDSGEAAP